MVDYHYFKSKLNHFYGRYVGYNQRPVFFDIDQTFPELNHITRHFPDIKKEFENVQANVKEFPRYHDIDPGESAISNTTEKNWNVFMLYLLGYQLKEARLLCPTLCNLLEGIPHLIQAFFSILEPGKSIPLHEGPYIGYLRYHLGIHVPKNNPPQILVNNQPYTWKEGEAVLFDDSWPHEVRNTSDDYRAVLIIDVLRPMPFLPQLVNQFVTHVIARYFYGRKVMKRAMQYGGEVKPLAL
ncbi:aspartyl/asparaginyl beta-hydroxylase domain-containing protein [Legionella pneumophila]|uniref:Peptide aspartate b-dioxygenase n=1 Tax=Legionella pneumophila subsp. pascullei TaxID=91890 RepID=A0AAX2IY54_LEGPN|nr:aspartyl/asparaginyl beta-hydroxylase domain-containing protein [Legionella pneumophila]AMP88970.1 peptide-aspartate beta-dioxygenase [Legionella pneumophila subsp. pascullei]AMP93362.1 peptide-aspartate beta-dioxygenase [Legionella pneumophila subsp. pascullei]AMP96328.1 peptide-aspartate beta-dioxygenase [Legionella pneumophila subsp. pascullei]SQG91295.1 peptide aspartate b-dioxygenase [Legionella pneumophila subsp. pascullei]VEH07841.1 peptide aspartate b-dioxygenase [Legionella pneumop